MTNTAYRNDYISMTCCRLIDEREIFLLHDRQRCDRLERPTTRKKLETATIFYDPQTISKVVNSTQTRGYLNRLENPQPLKDCSANVSLLLYTMPTGKGAFRENYCNS